MERWPKIAGWISRLANMDKRSNREKILKAGLKLVHERGFGAASVRDIIEAAGVPLGSFTNHFTSKEAFGLEILNLYFAKTREVLARTLRDDSLSPLARLHEYIKANTSPAQSEDTKIGCLFGNFSAESSYGSDAIRRRLVEIFDEIQNAVEYCLHAAVAAGELPLATECEDIAALIVSSLQGAILLAKAYRSSEPTDQFEKMLFASVLR
jgi:TetR/AcrR family transcriptional repressor of nem operon